MYTFHLLWQHVCNLFVGFIGAQDNSNFQPSTFLFQLFEIFFNCLFAVTCAQVNISISPKRKRNNIIQQTTPAKKNSNNNNKYFASTKKPTKKTTSIVIKLNQHLFSWLSNCNYAFFLLFAFISLNAEKKTLFFQRWHKPCFLLLLKIKKNKNKHWTNTIRTYKKDQTLHKRSEKVGDRKLKWDDRIAKWHSWWSQITLVDVSFFSLLFFYICLHFMHI